MKRDILRWMFFSLIFVLLVGCNQGMTLKGEGDDSISDDDTGPTEPPPAPIDCGRRVSSQEDLQVVILWWQYDPTKYDLVDKFVIKRRQSGSAEWQQIVELEPDTSTAYQQYQDDSAECDITYYYRIYAVNAAGASDPCITSATRNCQQ